MSTQLAVVAIVFSPERTLSCLAKLSWRKEFLTLTAVATKPPFAISLSRCYRPGQVFDLDDLSN